MEVLFTNMAKRENHVPLRFMENGLIASVQPVRQALAGDVEMFDQRSMRNNQNRFCNRGPKFP